MVAVNGAGFSHKLVEHLDALAARRGYTLVCSCGWELDAVQDTIVRQRQPGQWHLLFKGVATENGYGDPIDASWAGRITQAFRPPPRFAQIHTAGFKG